MLAKPASISFTENIVNIYRKAGIREGSGLFLIIKITFPPFPFFLHAACQPEGGGDGGEDGDYHVDDHLPGFFLAV